MIIHANCKDEGLREAMFDGGASGICGTVDIGGLADAALIEEVLQRCVSKEFKIKYTVRERYDPTIFSRGPYVLQMYDESLQYRMKKRLSQ